MTRTRGATVARGAAVGVGAFLLDYLVTWVTAGLAVASTAAPWPFSGAAPDWKAVLWLVYDSHFVGTRTPQVFGPNGDLLAGSELLDTVALLGTDYLYAVPVVLLVVAGGLVAWHVGAAGPREGLLAGVTVAVGYLAVVVLALFVASDGGVAPSPLRAVVVAGIVYPVAFGALGGTLAGLLGRETAERRADPAAR